MKETNWLIPFAFFMFAFSIGMDLHHTNAIEGITEGKELHVQTDERTKTYEVDVVWVRKGTVGGGAFPTYPDNDYDSDYGIIIKSETRPDSAIVASKAVPPAPGYTLHRLVSVRQLR